MNKINGEYLPRIESYSRIGDLPTGIEVFPLWTNPIKSVLIKIKILERQIEMEKKKDRVHADSRLDFAHLIRSVQRIEGNPDCFGRSNGCCDQADCCWRSYCLGSSMFSPGRMALVWTNKEVRNGKSKKGTKK